MTKTKSKDKDTECRVKATRTVAQEPQCKGIQPY